MAEILDLATAVEGLVRDGDCLALEGFTHLIPFAAAHEIIRQGRRDLTLVRLTPDVAFDQMIGMGCARKLVFSWGGNPGVGSLHRLRDAVEQGNVQFWGITGVQKEAVLASARSLVTVEEIVEELVLGPGAVVLPSWVVTAVAPAPGGSHPSYSLGYSDRDDDFHVTWDAISRDRETFLTWMRQHVLEPLSPVTT